MFFEFAKYGWAHDLRNTCKWDQYTLSIFFIESVHISLFTPNRLMSFCFFWLLFSCKKKKISADIVLRLQLVVFGWRLMISLTLSSHIRFRKFTDLFFAKLDLKYLEEIVLVSFPEISKCLTTEFHVTFNLSSSLRPCRNDFRVLCDRSSLHGRSLTRSVVLDKSVRQELRSIRSKRHYSE